MPSTCRGLVRSLSLNSAERGLRLHQRRESIAGIDSKNLLDVTTRRPLLRCPHVLVRGILTMTKQAPSHLSVVSPVSAPDDIYRQVADIVSAEAQRASGQIPIPPKAAQEAYIDALVPRGRWFDCRVHVPVLGSIMFDWCDEEGVEVTLEQVRLPLASFAIWATAGVSVLTAVGTVLITSALARRREHEADWRKLKLAQYQEYVAALSGVVRERATAEGKRRYADAVNSMALVASVPVLEALGRFQAEITYVNQHHSDAEHDRLLDELFRAMRGDVQPPSGRDNPSTPFRLLGLPPDAIDGNAVTPP